MLDKNTVENRINKIEAEQLKKMKSIDKFEMENEDIIVHRENEEVNQISRSKNKLSRQYKDIAIDL
jgi:hypothetical protein